MQDKAVVLSDADQTATNDAKALAAQKAWADLRAGTSPVSLSIGMVADKAITSHRTTPKGHVVPVTWESKAVVEQLMEVQSLEVRDGFIDPKTGKGKSAGFIQRGKIRLADGQVLQCTFSAYSIGTNRAAELTAVGEASAAADAALRDGTDDDGSDDE